ncbi:MAG: TIM barrel protein [Opitutaceae bacterium]|nr:TIM barrel protein [Opitutaceae bacterium]
MNRRNFLRDAAAMAGASFASAALLPRVSAAEPGSPSAPRFRHKYAPHAGQFEAHAGKNVLDQIRFARDAGFTAWEDNGMRRRERGEQDAMAELLRASGMTLGVFVAYAEFKHPVFAGNRLSIDDRKRDPQAVREMLAREMEATVELAARVGARWCTVVPGAVDPSLLPEQQTANVVENLRHCAAICEKAGVVLVLEPLNYMDHPGCFLQRAAQAHQICRMVGSPSVKILFDIYHQQITEGNLVANMTDAWDEIAYIQVGDVPGRKEPTTGEINFKHLFQWLRDRGYAGVIGMEHGLRTRGLEGEQALIAAYRAVDGGAP